MRLYLAGCAKLLFILLISEPIAGDSPLWNTKNLLVTPHIAAMRHPSFLITPSFIEHYDHYIGKRPLKYVIDLDRGYSIREGSKESQ